MNETVTNLPGAGELRINSGGLGRSVARGMDGWTDYLIWTAPCVLPCPVEVASENSNGAFCGHF